MSIETDKNKAIEWLESCSKYFANRPTGGEDMAHWANVMNAENATKVAQLIKLLDKEPLALEEMVARSMLQKIIERNGSVDCFSEDLSDHPERELSFLADSAIQVVRNAYRLE